MARVTIVVGHPQTDTFCEALGEAYARGARAAGHEVTIFVAGKMQFDPILHVGFTEVQTLEPDLQRAHDATLAANHLVIIFPLYLGTMPAILKGFLERVLQPDMVKMTKAGGFVRLLKGKTARVIVTMGMPTFVYRWWFRAYAVKMLRRNILGWMGVNPVRTTIYGGIESAGDGGRAQWLKDVEKMGRRLR